MTDIEFSIVTKVFKNGVWVKKEVTRKYKIEWSKNYAGVYNEDMFFVDDIALDGSSQKSKEEYIIDILKSWK